MYPDLSLESLPTHIRDALLAIRDGATPDSLESEILEFKEDPIHNAAGNAQKARAQLLEKLIDESVCLANGDAAGGHIVVGLADKKSGPEAFTGTDYEPDDVERKIFHGTKPNLRVEAHNVEVFETQLLVIRIPEALSLYTRTKGQASRRVGSSCEVLSEEQREAIRVARANPDFSNRISDVEVSEIRLDVVQEVRRLLKGKREKSGLDGAVPETTLGLLREVGLVSDQGKLFKAGEILLAEPSAGDVRIRHLWRAIPGAEPVVTEFDQPLILALPMLMRLIGENANREIERVHLPSGQEYPVPRFPSSAVDEVITNAAIHREWRTPRPIIIDQSPRVLKVWSPGPLPIGVSPARLLTTQSIPRNNRLMAAMRMLGMAEESSRGFDRMWASMISTGRDVPEVNTSDDHVEVILAASQPDVDFILALHRIEETYGDKVARNVNVLILLRQLWQAPLVTEKQVGHLTQASPLEVRELMEFLCDIGLLELVRDAPEWVLSSHARQIMNKDAPEDLAVVTIEEWIDAQLRDGKSLRSSEIADVFGISRIEATEHLRRLRTLGRIRIDPDGPQRGPSTSWIQT